MRHLESALQASCVSWFRMQYPHITIFAIPNGGNRNAVTGAILKREGALAGVADLFVMKPSTNYAGLFIEMKAAKGRQSEKQGEFQKKAIDAGYAYKVIASLDEFVREVRAYLYD
jgi:hypothetical protein